MPVIVKRWYQQMSLCLSSIVLAACGQVQLPSGLVYCSEGNPESFNPQLVTSGTTIDATSHQIYSRLVNYSQEKAEITPGLATSWQVSDDGLSYVFTLREHVSFHKTRHFTPARDFNADDVLFSFNRIIDPLHPYHLVSRTGYPFFQSIGFADLIGYIEKVNDYQVIFHLTRKDASFLSNLATDFAVVLSAEYGYQLLAQGTPEDIDYYAVGTGPFQLSKYVKNEYIRFKKNPVYWGPTVEIDQLVFDITPRSTARIAKLITGDCSVSALPKAGELAVLDQHKDIIIDAKPGLNVAFWAFNTQKPPLDDVRVRRALAHAIDKNNILDVVYNDTAVEATGVLPPASWAYSKNLSPNEYNPEKAKVLLHQAGVSNLSINVWAMPVARIYNPSALKTAELIQADLARVGVKLNIISYDWSVFTQKLASSNYDSVLIGWNADNSDPDNFFTPLLSCAALASNNNRSRWCNKDFEHLLTQAQSVSTQPERKAFYQSAEAIISDQVPLVTIAHAKKVVLKKSNITAMQIRPYGGISFAKTTQAIEGTE
ncbi:ABC transporter substrate-binding protein [Shewanella frigidimarina]|uniref:Peptide ABC transporter substrate-binding protein n=1 Tax=Shewanella frigidimarina TaxID=56812 RepID=A0A106C010_SHEFR|nr:ABC transporter substrate-binding protein [Shewanella frigidimarina]KVX01738.1 peptide ABC transporter substrate-binding protein [Shewanella frigidimarina]